MGNQQSMGVDARCDTFEPIKSFFKANLLGDIKAVYGKDEIKLTIKGKEAVENKISYTPPVYDNEQAVYIVRLLPLIVGYSVDIPIFAPGAGEQLQCVFHVTGKESVKVPTGTYECYKGSLKVKQGEATFLDHEIWYSVEAPYYMVKYSAGLFSFHLAKISDKIEKKSGKKVNKSQQWESQEFAKKGWRLWVAAEV